MTLQHCDNCFLGEQTITGERRLHHENILKNSFSNTAGKMKNLVSMNTPYMLVITRGLSLNGWIKNENMQLKVLELAFTANVVPKNLTFYVEIRRKNQKTEKVQFPNYLSLT